MIGNFLKSIKVSESQLTATKHKFTRSSSDKNGKLFKTPVSFYFIFQNIFEGHGKVKKFN